MRVLTRLWIETSQLTLYHLALAAGEKGVKSSKVLTATQTRTSLATSAPDRHRPC